ASPPAFPTDTPDAARRPNNTTSRSATPPARSDYLRPPRPRAAARGPRPAPTPGRPSPTCVPADLLAGGASRPPTLV
ncbi:hypothetical protein QM806_41320, partial [Rhodococcus sp. IEGM 1351]|nr:hypothetical protein [Rhodococcus sp. IEGM 1351]